MYSFCLDFVWLGKSKLIGHVPIKLKPNLCIKLYILLQLINLCITSCKP